MNFQVHTDTNIGQTNSRVTTEEISNGLGGKCWVARTTIDSIFGQSIDGCELRGIGRTREEALERLGKELDEFNKLLWI